MKTVILVPRRADNGHRDKLWAFTKRVWEERHPEWEIFEGIHDDGGPFNRSAAVNEAARRAFSWDTALIIDADVITNPDCVKSAVQVAQETGRLVIAHDERIMLNRRGTEQVLGGYKGTWRDQRFIETIWQDSVSCAVATTRELFDAANGFDELFVGWGREDTAFRIACEVHSGPILKVSGETFHLWHEASVEVARNSPTRRANEERHQAYVSGRWNKEVIDALTHEADTQEVSVNDGIPHILHRTVPEVTTPEVEAYWSAFEELHPEWDLRTYREPINPADWPLTGELFEMCENGAQKAGLIRLEALFTYGGIYVDSDCEPFRALDSLTMCSAFAGWEDANVIPDAVLGACAGHPAFQAMLEQAKRAVRDCKGAWESGPGVSTRVLRDRSDVLVLPPGSFYPMHYLDRQSRERVVADRPPWAFLIHHYAHSWGSESEKARITARQAP